MWRLGLVIGLLGLAGCIPPSLYQEEDKRAIAYYQEHTPGSRFPAENERLSETDIILNGLQVCKAFEEISDVSRALNRLEMKFDRYDPAHRKIIYAAGVHGYCPEQQEKLPE